MDAIHRLRKQLHDRAEPSGHEQETAAHVQGFLEAQGIHVESGVGGHGLLARVPGPGPGDGPVRLLRAELDAITVAKAPDGAGGGAGARHGCGHDGHMAMLCGGLARLAADPPPHPVVALFQPSEEDGDGMARCLQDARLRDLDVRDTFALHNLPGVPLGRVVLAPGALASTGLRLTFTGSESHAAHPHEGHSPWPALRDTADATAALQHDEPTALATLVHARLGAEAYGISPGTGIVATTLRGSDTAVAALRRDLEQAARTAARTHGVALRVEAVEPFPETRNDPDALSVAKAAAREAGLEVEARPDPYPWSEDFGHATARWPGALVGLGSGVDQPPLHDDRYVFPDDLLDVGVRFWETLGRRP